MSVLKYELTKRGKVQHFPPPSPGGVPSPVSLRHASNGMTEYTLDGTSYAVIQQPEPLVFIQELDDDLYDEIQWQGFLELEFEAVSDCVASVAYELFLDNGAFVPIPCADLAALQVQIDSNITGNRETGTKFIIRCIPTYKVGRGLEKAVVRVYASEAL